MGYTRWNADDWTSYSTSTAHKSADQIFTRTSSTGMDEKLNPLGVKLRESRDSDLNPRSNAVIVGVDVTGSMGRIAVALAKEGLGVLFQEILDRKPVEDPQLMFMAIGDAIHDRAPLQVSQFESSNVIVEQLTQIWVEGNGGGNDFESYNLPWYFAATHTSIDCFEKRGKKGYLFTVGDEFPAQDLTIGQIKKTIGDDLTQPLGNDELLTMVSRMYHVFHVIVEQGSVARREPKRVLEAWQDVLGQNVLQLSDYTKLSEVIVSAIQVNEGNDRDKVAASWKGDTALVVQRAVGGLTKATSKTAGVIRL